jgi:hypothetical protein
VVERASSLNLREKRMILNRISNFARVYLTHTLATSNDRSQATVSIIFWVMDQGHHKQLQDRMHIQCAGRMSIARLHDRTPICYAEHTPTHRCVCITKTNQSSHGDMSICRANPVLGLLWQNQPELYRLKYASPLQRAPTYFKRYNPLACRVTSR